MGMALNVLIGLVLAVSIRYLSSVHERVSRIAMFAMGIGAGILASSIGLAILSIGINEIHMIPAAITIGIVGVVATAIYLYRIRKKVKLPKVPKLDEHELKLTQQ